MICIFNVFLGVSSFILGGRPVEEAIKCLEQIKIAELKLNGEKYQFVTGAKHYANSVLKSVGLSGYKKLLPGMI